VNNTSHWLINLQSFWYLLFSLRVRAPRTVDWRVRDNSTNTWLYVRSKKGMHFYKNEKKGSHDEEQKQNKDGSIKFHVSTLFTFKLSHGLDLVGSLDKKVARSL
jgi:hypothetical protein